MERLKLPYKTFSLSYQGKPRILMKFANDKTMSEVLNAAARKFGIDKKKFDLRYGNHVLDLSTQLGYCNLPEGAVLEIVKSNADNNPSHIVPVELSFVNDDIFVKGRFRLNDSLWDVIRQLMPPYLYFNEDSLCLRYLNKAIIGKRDLRRTKLGDFPSIGRLEFVCERSFEVSLPSVSKHKPQKTSTIQNERLRKSLDANANNLEETGSSQEVFDEDESREYTASTPNSFTSPSDVSFAESNKLHIKPEIVNISERYGKIYHSKYMQAVELLEMTNSNRKKMQKNKRPSSEKEITKLDTIIKINLPDSYVFQAKFNSQETIEDVITVLKKYLRDPREYFYLYTAHPKLIMTGDRHLKDLKCFPKGMLYFSNTNRNEKRSYLRESIMAGLIGAENSTYESWANEICKEYETPIITPVMTPKRPCHAFHQTTYV